jgi:hypothetical protein
MVLSVPVATMPSVSPVDSTPSDLDIRWQGTSVAAPTIGHGFPRVVRPVPAVPSCMAKRAHLGRRIDTGRFTNESAARRPLNPPHRSSG